MIDLFDVIAGVVVLASFGILWVYLIQYIRSHVYLSRRSDLEVDAEL